MKVKELIAILNKYPINHEVVMQRALGMGDTEWISDDIQVMDWDDDQIYIG